jgi:hypothetical protein
MSVGSMQMLKFAIALYTALIYAPEHITGMFLAVTMLCHTTAKEHLPDILLQHELLRHTALSSAS